MNRQILIKAVSATIALNAFFWVIVLGYLLPATKQELVEQKKRMLRELVHTAHSAVRKQHEDSRQGRISQVQARKNALAIIKNKLQSTQSVVVSSTFIILIY